MTKTPLAGEVSREHIEDLLYYDGPLLALSRDCATGIAVLTYWLDCDDKRNVWVDFWLKNTDLEALLRDEVAMAEGFSRASLIERYETYPSADRVNPEAIQLEALEGHLPAGKMKLSLSPAFADSVLDKFASLR